MILTNEDIFSIAIALDQLGRFKNEIYCSDKDIFIVNYDRTTILKFKAKNIFIDPVSFYANDFEDSKYQVKDGKVIFDKKKGGILSTKICRIPDFSIQEVQDLFDKFWNKDQSNLSRVSYNKEIVDCLQQDLSHIEFISDNKVPILIQRDIYSGNIIRLKKAPKKGFGDGTKPDSLKDDFQPIGIRTNDFIALFTFINTVTFAIHPSGHYFLVRSNGDEMRGIVGGCLYDDLGTINFIEGDKKEKEVAKKETTKKKRRF